MTFRTIWLILIAGVFSFHCSSKKGPDKLQQVLGLQKMSKLASTEYIVTKIIKANDNKTWYKLGDRKILMSCRASIIAGIDLAQLSTEDIQIEGDHISVTLPRASILFVNIKPEDIRTEYEEVAPFRSQFTSQEKNQLAVQGEKQIREAISSMGILTTAETNASLFINNFLHSLGFQNINIQYSSPKPILQ